MTKTESIARRAAKDITKGYDIKARIEMAIKEALAQEQEQEPMKDVIKAAQGVLEFTELRHRPPVRDQFEVGRMVMVRLHALAALHDALTAHNIKE